MIMKRIIILVAFVLSFHSFSQTTLFQDSFETYDDFIISDFGQWKNLDLDLLFTYTGGTVGTPTWPNAGSPQAFQIFNPATALVSNSSGNCNPTENLNFTPKSGAKFAACWAGEPLSNGQNATANNDWIISPPINLSGVTGSQLSFWYKGLSDCYGAELFKVGIYIGTGTPTQASDFTIISPLPFTEANSYITWSEYIQNLTSYNGQTIRIGIQCISNDRYMFMIDDFKVTATTLGTSDLVSSQFSMYPNPTNNFVVILNKGSIGINSVSLADGYGRIVKTIIMDGAISETQINLSDLNSGVYFMAINTNEGAVTKKIVKN